MRSLYFRILLASLLTAVVVLLAFMAISRIVVTRTTVPLFAAAYSLQLEQAIDAYEHAGRPGLAAFVSRLDAAFHLEHHVVSGAGTDLVTGQDRSALLDAQPGVAWTRRSTGGRTILVRTSDDGRYRLIIIAPPPFTAWTFAPFYVLVLVAVLFFSWLVAVGIALPLRTLAGAVDRFGAGDLSSRVTYNRRNEIGRLARSFNQMADRIRTLLAAERRLLQDVSHELRSPLARLSFGVELARTAEDRDAALDRVQREVDRLSSLVGELIEVSRAEGDPGARKTVRVPLQALVTEVVEACALEAEARGCTLAPGGVSGRVVYGDPELLRRAVENVLRNAIRFAPKGTAVDVTLHECDSRTEVIVRDRGPGVPDAALPRLFESFYRVDESRDAQTGGLGLGLAIAHRAMQLHHGSAAAVNDVPGLRVTLALPHTGAGEPAMDGRADTFQGEDRGHVVD